jgi:predicted Zn-dependent protease
MKRALTLIAVLGLALGAGLLRLTRTPPAPTWQQDVVTVDDLALLDLALQWETPFDVAYQPRGRADITTTSAALGDMTGGEAKRTVDGDRITACRITTDADRRPNDQALLHELGHCFGLHHSNDDSTSLMYWVQGGASGSPTITPADRDNLSALYSQKD